jgi:serine/threonine protein kinase
MTSYDKKFISDDMESFLLQHLDNLTPVKMASYHHSFDSFIMNNETHVVKVYSTKYNSVNLEDIDYERIQDISLKLSELIPEYVPKIYATHKLPNELAIVMEKIDSKPLYEYINANSDNDYNPSEIVTIVTSLCKAVTAMNNAGYIHGHIDDSNIMLGNDLSVKLIDFSFSDEITAVDPGDGITPKLVHDTLMLSSVIARLIFIMKPTGSVYEVLKSIEDFTIDDIIGDKETATELYNVLNVFRPFWVYND